MSLICSFCSLYPTVDVMSTSLFRAWTDKALFSIFSSSITRQSSRTLPVYTSYSFFPTNLFRSSTVVSLCGFVDPVDLPVRLPVLALLTMLPCRKIWLGCFYFFIEPVFYFGYRGGFAFLLTLLFSLGFSVLILLLLLLRGASFVITSNWSSFYISMFVSISPSFSSSYQGRPLTKQ